MGLFKTKMQWHPRSRFRFRELLGNRTRVWQIRSKRSNLKSIKMRRSHLRRNQSQSPRIKKRRSEIKLLSEAKKLTICNSLLKINSFGI